MQDPNFEAECKRLGKGGDEGQRREELTTEEREILYPPTPPNKHKEYGDLTPWWANQAPKKRPYAENVATELEVLYKGAPSVRALFPSTPQSSAEPEATSPPLPPKGPYRGNRFK